MVERVDLLFLTRGRSWVATQVTVSLRRRPAAPGDVRYSRWRVRGGLPAQGAATASIAARVVQHESAGLPRTFGRRRWRRRTQAYAGPPGPASRRRTLRADRWWLYPLTTFVVFIGVRRLRDDPGLPGHALLRRALPLAVLLALPRRLRRGRLRLRPAVRLVAALGGADHPDLPARLPDDLLLLPQGLLPVVLASPPACAVAEPHTTYTGETRLPLILNNLHRYFWYAAVVVGADPDLDTVLTFRDARASGGHMGLGTLVFIANIVLIWLYTLSCHSCRHAVGGRLRHFSKHPVRYQAVDLGLQAERQPRARTPGSRCSPWPSPTSTCCCSPPAPSPTRGSSDGG